MANQTIKLTCTERTTFGKGAARQARREGGIPAVVYGHGEGPFHVILPGHEAFIALRHTNALMTLTWGSGEDRLVLAKDVQRDPIKPIIEHVDLVIVKRGEKVTVDVPVNVCGVTVDVIGLDTDHHLARYGMVDVSCERKCQRSAVEGGEMRPVTKLERHAQGLAVELDGIVEIIRRQNDHADFVVTHVGLLWPDPGSPR